MNRFRDTLLSGAQAMGFFLSPGQLESMVLHGQEILEWSSVTNVTAIKDPSELAEKLFLDVIPLLEEVPVGARVLDVGSGGGFPGIPLKILRPDIHMTLIDGRRKKVSFLKHMIRTLRMAAEAYHVRAEEFPRGFGERAAPFDTVLSKAVADPRSLFDICWPLVLERGRIIAMGGTGGEKLLAEAKKLGGLNKRVLRIKPYVLPFSKIKRTLVILERGQ